jgi:hypothetical protein
MFGTKTTDVERWLTAARDQARTECRFNQDEIAKKMGQWIGQDRRFDGIRDKEAFAREVMSCRQSGKELDLSKRLRIDTVGGQTAGITSRW